MSLAPLDKCTVTGSVLKPDGTPVFPGAVTFTLSRRDRDGDTTIMPVTVEAETDRDGNISVDLWPNVDGQAGTVYTAVVQFGKRGTPRTIYPAFKVVVPDEETANLADISELVPPPSVDDARAQVLLAVAAKNEAVAAKDAAEAAAASTDADVIATAADRVATGEDRVATGEDRSAAESAAATATTQAGIATSAAGDASDSAAAAAGSAQSASDDADATAADRIAVAADKAAAGDSATLSQKWAEGTLPGGAGTKSAKEHATDAAASAATASAATQIEHAIPVYNLLGVPTGVYYTSRRTPNHSIQTSLHAEIINGEPGGEVDFNMLVDDVAVYGPATAAVGTPIDVTDLEIDIPAGSAVNFTIIAVRGIVIEFLTECYGAVA